MFNKHDDLAALRDKSYKQPLAASNNSDDRKNEKGRWS